MSLFQMGPDRAVLLEQLPATVHLHADSTAGSG